LIAVVIEIPVYFPYFPGLARTDRCPVTDSQPRINQASAASAHSTPLANDHSLLHPHSDVKLTLQFYSRAVSQDRMAAVGEILTAILSHESGLRAD
jgi:hypothetical protein